MRTSFISLLVLAALPLAHGGNDSPHYVAHEWGTFTSVQGSDGRPLAWNPFVVADLPGFVLDRNHPSRNDAVQGLAALSLLGGKDSSAWLQRLETPVIYFYSDDAQTVDVKVDFPNGLLTEWFPQVTSFGPVGNLTALLAASAESHLRWDDLKIFAAADSRQPALLGCLPVEANPSHYYPARKTGANLVEAGQPFAMEPRLQRDRFLFYRGAGSFEAPLRAGASRDGVDLVNGGAEPLGPLVVVRVEKDRINFQAVDPLLPGAHQHIQLAHTPPSEPSTAAFAKLTELLQADLTGAGLRADEASAMIATWRDDWLHDQGLRVLYLLPRPWTDRILPIRFDPPPSELVRVMVGRADIFDPQTEDTVRTLVQAYARGEHQTAFAGLADLDLGRMLEPAITRAGTMLLNESVLAGGNSPSRIPVLDGTPEAIRAWWTQMNELKAGLRTQVTAQKVASLPASTAETATVAK